MLGFGFISKCTLPSTCYWQQKHPFELAVDTVKKTYLPAPLIPVFCRLARTHTEIMV